MYFFVSYSWRAERAEMFILGNFLPATAQSLKPFWSFICDLIDEIEVKQITPKDEAIAMCIA